MWRIVGLPILICLPLRVGEGRGRCVASRRKIAVLGVGLRVLVPFAARASNDSVATGGSSICLAFGHILV